MILFELNTNEFGDGTHFFDPKILMNLLLDPEQEGRGVECFHSIINVKSNDADDASAWCYTVEQEHYMVNSAPSES